MRFYAVYGIAELSEGETHSGDRYLEYNAAKSARRV
jgi:hypothetical protein